MFDFVVFYVVVIIGIDIYVLDFVGVVGFGELDV